MTSEHSKFAHNDPQHEHQNRPGDGRSDKSPTSPEDSASKSASERTKRIRELNDKLRIEGRGGMVHMTNGVAALGLKTVNVIFACIADFTGFTPDNDPWNEHDCATMTVLTHRIIWKIDYYDRSRTYHSPDPADPKVTVRVLTVMLAEEY